jgi:uncharacterized delta-60 repeat protein
MMVGSTSKRPEESVMFATHHSEQVSAWFFKTVRGLVWIILVALTWSLQMARAADGDLDPTFGSGGKAMTGISGNDDYGRAIAIQPDGKIIVAGQSGVYPMFHATLARFNSDGSLDQTFGGSGIVVVPLDPNGDGLSSVVLQPDGKIVTAGSSIHNNFTVGCTLARFNANGTLDQAFGNGGSVLFNFGDSAAEGNAVVLQPDGKIIVVGVSGAGTYSELNDFAVARFNFNGTPDQSFGIGGKLKTHFDGEFNTGSRAMTALLQPDGNLVVAGAYKNEGTPHAFALARYNSNGALDPSFGSGGKITTDLGNDAFGASLVRQPDGKLVLTGYFDAGQRNHDFALVRYNPNGSLDTTFGNSGHVITDLFGTSDDIANALLLQSDGKLIAAGRTGQYPNFRFGLARYNSDGSFDQSFGNGGKALTDFGGSSNQAYSVVLQADGKILAAGYTINSTIDFAVARYTNAPPTPDTVTIADAVYVDRTRQLNVHASSSANGTLSIYNFFTDEFIGTLPANGDGTFNGIPNPRKITVRSTLGGSAVAVVRSPGGRVPSGTAINAR